MTMVPIRPGRRVAMLLLVAGLGVTGAAAGAPDSQRAGDYTIHYNALSGDALPVVSTRAYGLRHDASQGLVTITVNAGPGAAGATLPLTVTGRAATLLGRTIPIKVRYIDDKTGHSALVTFDIHGSQSIRFDLDVTPQNASTTHLRFVHTYTP